MKHLRGQAIVETAVFMSFFTFLIIAVIWAGRDGIWIERNQAALRYANVILSVGDPAVYDRAAEAYANLHNNFKSGYVTANGNGCQDISPAMNTLLNGQTYDGTPGIGFFNPTIYTSLWGMTGNTMCATRQVYTGNPHEQALVFIAQTATVLTDTLNTGNTTLDIYSVPQQFTSTMFSPPDMQTMLECWGQLEDAATNTFDPMSDTSSPSNPASLYVFGASFSTTPLALTCGSN